MASVFETGRVIDVILVLVFAELVGLALVARARPGPRSLDIVGHLASGVCLLLALRAALTDAHWMWAAAFLAAALPAHVFDIYRRFAEARIMARLETG